MEDNRKTHSICFLCMCKEEGLEDELSRFILVNRIKLQLIRDARKTSSVDELRNMAIVIQEIDADFKCKGGKNNECNNDKRTAS